MASVGQVNVEVSPNRRESQSPKLYKGKRRSPGNSPKKLRELETLPDPKSSPGLFSERHEIVTKRDSQKTGGTLHGNFSGSMMLSAITSPRQEIKVGATLLLTQEQLAKTEESIESGETKPISIAEKVKVIKAVPEGEETPSKSQSFKLNLAMINTKNPPQGNTT